MIREATCAATSLVRKRIFALRRVKSQLEMRLCSNTGSGSAERKGTSAGGSSTAGKADSAVGK